MSPTLNPEFFETWPDGMGLNLIAPAKGGAVGNAPWTKETIKYRSRVETLDGTPVSVGFHKFFNLGTGPDNLQIKVDDIIKECGKGAIATLKLDGSLLIRSVYGGKVMLRTRGSFGYDHVDNASEMEIFKKGYPRIFDPIWYDSCSLLFEWVSPNNIIVLKYPEPELTLIGAVNHEDLTYFPMSALAIIAKVLGVPLVRYFPLTSDGWEELNASLETNAEIEGYVIRLNGEQDLVKVKCVPYLTKHALKSSLSTEKLADMFFQQGWPSFQAFSEQFISDFDEETYMWALGAISSLYDGVKEFNKIIAHMLENAQTRRGMSRKDAALAGLVEYGQTKRFSAYMNLWEGKVMKDDLYKSILLQVTKQTELGMFTKVEKEE